MQYLKEFGVLEERITDELIDLVQKDPESFTITTLYNPIRYAEHIRDYVSKTINSKTAINKFNELVNIINHKDKYYSYAISDGIITYIKNDPGGFFKNYDNKYISYKDNIITEWTMIICANANYQEGGETKFVINEFFTHTSIMTKTPKNCIVFMENIENDDTDGPGCKDIIIANLVAIPKDNKNVVIIGFPNSTKKYVISCEQVKSLGENFIANWLKFNRNEEHINYYEESFVPCDAFMAIYRIFTGTSVAIDQFRHSKTFIDYYCIDYSNIVIHFVYNGNIGEINFVDDFIISNSREYAITASKIAKELGYNYVPFTMIFVDGTLFGNNGFDGPDSVLHDVRPIFLSLTENDNILFIQSILAETPKKCMFDIISDNTRNSSYDDIDDYFMINKKKMIPNYNIKFVGDYISDDEDDDEDDDNDISEEDNDVSEEDNASTNDNDDNDVNASDNDDNASDNDDNASDNDDNASTNDNDELDERTVTERNKRCQYNSVVDVNNNTIEIELDEDNWFQYNNNASIYYKFKYCMQCNNYEKIIDDQVSDDPVGIDIKIPPINESFKPESYASTIAHLKSIDFMNAVKNEMKKYDLGFPVIGRSIQKDIYKDSTYAYGTLKFTIVHGIVKLNQ